MKLFKFNIERPLSYVLTGKFEAPSPNWTHEALPLLDYEFIVVTQGELYIRYQDENFSVKSGEFLLLPPSTTVHNYRKGFQPSDCSFYWMHFEANHDITTIEIPDSLQGSSLGDLGRDMIALPQQAEIPSPERILVLMHHLQDDVKSEFCRLSLNYMTTTILCELFNQFHQLHDPNAEPEKKTQKQMYHDIIDYVKLNTNQNLKVSHVAEHFGYNEKYLSHLFSKIAGIPLKQFILTNKMEVANFMLTDTNKSIQDIALSLGFSDSHNFAKAYKKICGLTPSEYRNAFSKRLLYHK